MINPAAASFVNLVQVERVRQDEKWGNQDHSLDHWLAVLAEEFGEFAKEVVELTSGGDDNPEPAIRELVETAAVAQAIYEQFFCKDVKDETNNNL